MIIILICIHCKILALISEPGYYEDGNFGLRHENIAMVVKADTKVSSLFGIILHISG